MVAEGAFSCRRVRFGALWLLLAVGCASPDAGRFATAAAKVVGDATSAYDQLNRAVRERKLAEVAANPAELPTDQTYAPLLAGKDLSARMGLLRGLGAYAKGLKELDAADTRAKVDTAAGNLRRALRTLDRGLADAGLETGLAPADLELFAAAVRRLGEGIAEARRRYAIRTAVKVADPGVRKAAELLAAELPKFGDFVEANLATVEAEMLAAYRKEATQMTFDQRLARLEEIGRRREMRTEAKAFFAAVGRAAGRLGEAHAAQHAAFELEDLNLPALAKAMTELEQAEADVRLFQERWQTWKGE